MIEVAQIGFWKVCWAFYRSTETLAERFPTLQFFTSQSHELCDNLQALGFFPWRPAKYSRAFCEIVSSRYFLSRSINVHFYHPRCIIQVSLSTNLHEYAWKLFRMLLIDNPHLWITINRTGSEQRLRKLGLRIQEKILPQVCSIQFKPV